tara:strand:- start:281 stop:1678 length:1398 start_codon:yes stop_codon:yes gene_type:complete
MKIMVDLPPVTLSKEGTTTVPQRDSDASHSEEFNELFKQSVNKVVTPESGIKKPEHGESLPNSSSPMIILESKVLRGGMLLLVGGDEPTNDVIEEFAQSQGVEAELLALLMTDPLSAGQTKSASINPAQPVSLLSNETSHTVIPSKFITPESTQPQTIKNSMSPLNLESARLGGVNDDGILIQAKNVEPSVALMDVMSKRASVHTLKGKSLLSEEKIPRAMDLLSGAVKETTKQNTLHMAIPSKFIVSESTLSMSTMTQSQTVQNLMSPLNLESAGLGGVDDDGILIQAKNAEPPVALMDVTGKRFSIERSDEVLIIKQEQHADMSKRLAEALGQRLTTQITKGVWQVELDIHPKSLGRIEIHLEMRGGELEAHFNASKALTRELLQDGMPRLKEELREHGIETAYLGLGSGKQGANDGNSTPFGGGDDEEDLDMAARQAKTAMLEPTVGPVKQQSLIEGLDITI